MARYASPVKPRETCGLCAGQLQVRLLGEVLSCTYDPRFGPDQQRSGLIRLGKANLMRILGGPVELIAARCIDSVIDLT